MDLQEFVATTITQIIEGVRQSQCNTGALVNPTLPDLPMREGIPSGGYVRTAGGLYVQVSPVEFDVAVSVSTEVGGSVEGKGKLLVASAEGSVEASHERTHISRVRFKVPVALPGQRDETREKELRDEKERVDRMLGHR